MTRVRGHYRNGRWVRSHSRRSPQKRSVGVAGVIAAVVLLVIVIAIIQAAK